ncbi:hypothetical protein DFR35_1409 [Sulfurisoma sediminicola]|uniref:BrxE family protein n=1 Tax=Sulfurisoma sediminicola TaxID=1381557 RepID=A0A497XCU4_9PROT|nr:hypothetical protein DFR35_1409 [Sulfurisoma sediminicola]
MNSSLSKLARLRIVAAYLGEKSQHAWWPTSFFGTIGNQFLVPVFPKTTFLAQYHGATEGARRLHDEHIGVGQVFHLFRLPEETEQDLHNLLLNSPDAIDASIISKKESAEAALIELAGTKTGASEGPVAIKLADDIVSDATVRQLAQVYAAAFTGGVRAYPYFSRPA